MFCDTVEAEDPTHCRRDQRTRATTGEAMPMAVSPASFTLLRSLSVAAVSVESSASAVSRSLPSLSFSAAAAAEGTLLGGAGARESAGSGAFTVSAVLSSSSRGYGGVNQARPDYNKKGGRRRCRRQ